MSDDNELGLITNKRHELTPAAEAEGQRAIAEVQAALTIAARFPRDEATSLEKIKTSCQRTGVAADAEYEYSRGGQSISGASIKLMEVVAQKWGNLDFGFRELARYAGVNGEAGESIVEAFAWDLESNTRRKIQFNVKHEMKAGGRMKTLSDPRDIYEFIANQAQRRVRTCLENVIPRDIVDEARDECRKTLKAKENVTPEKLAKMVKAFEDFGVTRVHIEKRLQRKLDTMSPAQFLKMKRIYTSLRDGVALADEFFDMTAYKTPSVSDLEKKVSPTEPRSDAKGGSEANEPSETSPAESQVAATVTDILDTAREAMRRKRSDESLDLVFEGACVDLEQAVSGTELRAAIAALGDCRDECLEKIGKQKPGDLFENDETAQDAS